MSISLLVINDNNELLRQALPSISLSEIPCLGGSLNLINKNFGFRSKKTTLNMMKVVKVSE